MEQTTPSQATLDDATGDAPFPRTAPAAQNARQTSGEQSAPAEKAAGAEAADTLIERWTQRAHDAVDGISERLTSAVDGVQGGLGKAADAPGEWVESAREAIRQHPLAALGTAVLVGLAVHSLTSSRRR